MTILCDIDDTLTNFGYILLKWNNKIFHTNYKYEDVTTWDFVTKAFGKDCWQALEYTTFWDEIKPLPNAVEVLENFVKQGHKVYLVTASSFNTTLSYKINKVLSWFDNTLINENNVIIAQNKNMIEGDILIDDAIHNLQSFDGCKICYACPWNTDWCYEKGNGSLRFNNWKEIEKTINDLIQIYYGG